jgi:hypothetical protein
MPNNAPPTLVELKQCKKTILCYIRESRKAADIAAKELATLQGALEHIEHLINNFDPGDKSSKRSLIPLSKRPAA